MNENTKVYLMESALEDAQLGIIYASMQKALDEGATVSEFIKKYLSDSSSFHPSNQHIKCLYKIVSKIYPDHKEEIEMLMLLI
jgi:hypothetical protein